MLSNNFYYIRSNKKSCNLPSCRFLPLLLSSLTLTWSQQQPSLRNYLWSPQSTTDFTTVEEIWLPTPEQQLQQQHKAITISNGDYSNINFFSGGDNAATGTLSSHFTSSGSSADDDVIISSPSPLLSQQVPLKVVNEWKYLDFQYPTYMERQRAIANREYIPENILPLGIDVYLDRIFVTTPRWKDGIPASIGTIPFPPVERSPAIQAYPEWSAHGDPYRPDCRKLISVYRTAIDVECGRLWLIDSGIVNATVALRQVCPPKVMAYDLQNNDQLVVHYELPPEQVKQDSLHSNIVVDVQPGLCHDAYAYISDVWRFGLVVFSLRLGRSWRVTNYQFSANPHAADFRLYGINFQWLDGVFGMSLQQDYNHVDYGGGNRNIKDSYPYRLLYFHPMASFKEFVVSTAWLRNESLWTINYPSSYVAQQFVAIGDRGDRGQSSTSAIARNGVMFYTQVHRDEIGCWNTHKSYRRGNLHILAVANRSLPLIQFPNDLKIDHVSIAERQSVWVMSNRLPIYLYDQLDYGVINFRILRVNVRDAIRNTVCDPLNYDSADTVVTATVMEGQCF